MQRELEFKWNSNQLFNQLMTRTLEDEQKENFDFHNFRSNEIKKNKVYEFMDESQPVGIMKTEQNLVYKTPNQTEKVENQKCRTTQ